MATRVLGLINGRLKFLYRKQRFLNLTLRRLLCNALIQPHYDYACSAWYPNLNKRLTKRIQTSQNKCIRYCLKLGNRAHIGANEFRNINWLPTKERFEQCVCANIFKFYNKNSPAYISEMYHPIEQGPNTRSSKFKLQQPYRSSNLGQNGLSYLGPKLWNRLPSHIKSAGSLNIFKHVCITTHLAIVGYFHTVYAANIVNDNFPPYYILVKIWQYSY